MSRFFPHASHAEEQTLSQTLLYSHVLYRGFQTGATLGLTSVALRSAGRYIRGRSMVTGVASLATTGRWAVVTTLLMIPTTYGRMYGREEIEWQDRAWRLMEHEGQKEVDDWSLIGMAVGGVASTRLSIANKTGTARFLSMAGGAGIGSLAGVVGYMVWRYGICGGQRMGSERG